MWGKTFQITVNYVINHYVRAEIKHINPLKERFRLTKKANLSAIYETYLSKNDTERLKIKEYA